MVVQACTLLSAIYNNELLVEFYLKNKAGDDLRMKRWISSQMVAKTYYHNFVTHLLEAYFQREYIA